MVSLALLEERVFRIGGRLPNSVISIGSAMVSWSSRKKGSVALGTADAKFISASVASWKPHGFRSCSLIYIDSSLEPVVISMTTRDVSNIRDSCVSRPLFETHGDGYHLYVIWSDGELLVFGIYTD